MTVLTRITAAALVAGAAVAVVDGRQQAVFRSETNFIEVVASVTDKDGNFVRDLTLDDFELREQGRREKLDTISFVELPTTPGAPSARPAAYRSDVPAEARIAEGRLYLLYLSGASSANAPWVRRLATEFVSNHLLPGDRAAIWDTQFPLRQTEFTDDKTKLLADIEPYTGSGSSDGLPFATRCRPGMSFEGVAVGFREQCQAALQQPERELRDAVNYFNAIQGRRKSIVLFSGGWNGVSDPVSRADITLYAVDARGLVGMDAKMMGSGLVGEAAAREIGNQMSMLNDSVDGLRRLANRTGGFALVNSNEFAPGFQRIVEANSRYYVLGYASSYTGRDRVLRELELKVKRPGLKVQARRGYFPRW